MATPVEEYVPQTTPINKAVANHFVVEPPRITKESNIKTIVIELLIDRLKVSVTA